MRRLKNGIRSDVCLKALPPAPNVKMPEFSSQTERVVINLH